MIVLASIHTPPWVASTSRRTKSDTRCNESAPGKSHGVLALYCFNDGIHIWAFFLSNTRNVHVGFQNFHVHKQAFTKGFCAPSQNVHKIAGTELEDCVGIGLMGTAVFAPMNYDMHAYKGLHRTNFIVS